MQLSLEPSQLHLIGRFHEIGVLCISSVVILNLSQCCNVALPPQPLVANQEIYLQLCLQSHGPELHHSVFENMYYF